MRRGRESEYSIKFNEIDKPLPADNNKTSVATEMIGGYNN